MIGLNNPPFATGIDGLPYRLLVQRLT